MEKYSISDYEIIFTKQVTIKLLLKKIIFVFYYHINNWCLIVFTAKVTHQKYRHFYH